MKIKLLEDYGAAKAGSIFESATDDETKLWDFFRPRTDNMFLLKHWLVEGTYQELTDHTERASSTSTP